MHSFLRSGKDIPPGHVQYIDRMTEHSMFKKFIFGKYEQESEIHWRAELESKLLAKEKNCLKSRKKFTWNEGCF